MFEEAAEKKGALWHHVTMVKDAGLAATLTFPLTTGTSSTASSLHLIGGKKRWAKRFKKNHCEDEMHSVLPFLIPQYTMKSDLAHPGACLCVEERKEEASKLCISEHDASLMKQFDKLHSVLRTYTLNKI